MCFLLFDQTRISSPNLKTCGHMHDTCAKIRHKRGLGVVPPKKRKKRKEMKPREAVMSLAVKYSCNYQSCDYGCKRKAIKGKKKKKEKMTLTDKMVGSQDRPDCLQLQHQSSVYSKHRRQSYKGTHIRTHKHLHMFCYWPNIYLFAPRIPCFHGDWF